jgi:hypothetical protein
VQAKERDGLNEFGRCASQPTVSNEPVILYAETEAEEVEEETLSRGRSIVNTQPLSGKLRA